VRRDSGGFGRLRAMDTPMASMRNSAKRLTKAAQGRNLTDAEFERINRNADTVLKAKQPS
jgi:hypothetical protein